MSVNLITRDELPLSGKLINDLDKLFVSILSSENIERSNINLSFLLYCLVGGICQIFATFLLLKIFTTSNFALGTTYSKTEPIQAAFFGFILLNEPISLMGLIGILLGLAGVVVTSYNKFKNIEPSFFEFHNLRQQPYLIDQTLRP